MKWIAKEDEFIFESLLAIIPDETVYASLLLIFLTHVTAKKI